MYNTCRIKVLSGTNKDEIFDFNKFMVSIGSLGTDDIKLSSLSGVLPNHVTIRQEDNKFFFLNNCYSSVNVNGKPLTEGELFDGDEIQFGTIGPKLLFKTDLTEVPSEDPADFVTLKSPEEEFSEVKTLEYIEELPFEKQVVRDNQLIDEEESCVTDNNDLIEEIKEDVFIEKANVTENPVDFVTLKSPEEEFPEVKSLEYFEELPFEEPVITPVDQLVIVEENREEYTSIIEDNNINSVEQIESHSEVRETIKGIDEVLVETNTKKKPLMIQKANYRKTTYGKNIDELETIVDTDEAKKIEKILMKKIEPKKQTRQEMLNEMTSIIDEHNKKQNNTHSDDEKHFKRSGKVKKVYNTDDKIEYKLNFSVDNRVYSSGKELTDNPPYIPYICVAGGVSAILFTIGLSISDNGFSFFTLAPIVIALIAVDSINNTYRFDENRLTNSIFMTMGIVILQSIIVVVLCLIGSLGQLGQYDIISYFLNQIMFLSHQFFMCIILLFVCCVATIIYIQAKFPDSL